MKTSHLVALLGMLPAASSFAGDLSGQVMRCSADFRVVATGSEETSYQFIQDADGQNVVLVKTAGVFGPGLATQPYFLDGTRLAINTPDAGHIDDTTPVYDISKPTQIRRSREQCIYPGVPDGDSRPVCETVTETCSLD